MISLVANSFMVPQDCTPSEETVLRVPDQTGLAGQAWLLSSTTAKACLEGWLVHRPGAHPIWDQWVVGVVHLRDEPGFAPAKKSYSRAEYEFQIRTINPSFRADPELCDLGFPYLDPPDVIEQFHGVTDTQARFVCKESVRWIVNGAISPDTDYRSRWSSELKRIVSKLADERLTMN